MSASHRLATPVDTAGVRPGIPSDPKPAGPFSSGVAARYFARKG